MKTDLHCCNNEIYLRNLSKCDQERWNMQPILNSKKLLSKARLSSRKYGKF
nr:MAG TPA: toxin [Caudoviricetes sp.]